MNHERSTNQQRLGAAATVTIVGGSMLVNGAPVVAADFEVTNTNDSGAGSLAQAIADANLTPALDTITFASDVSGTINFSTVSKVKYDLSIVGPGDGSITLTTAGADVLYVYNSAALTLSGLSFDSSAGNTGVNVNGAGDITVANVEAVRSLITGSGAGEIDLSGIEATASGYSLAVSLESMESLSFVDITGTNAASYYSSARFSFRQVGTGDAYAAAAGADVVLATLGGDLDGVNLYVTRVVGDVVVDDVELGGGLRIRTAGDATISNVSFANDSFGSVYVGGVDRGFVNSVDLGSGRSGRVSLRGVGLGPGAVEGLDRITVNDVTDVDIAVGSVRGNTSISEVTSTSLNPDARLTVYGASGDVAISDVSMSSPYSSLRVDADAPSISAGDPFELSSMSLSDVEIGAEGSAAELDISDFNELRVDGETEHLDDVDNVSLERVTVWGVADLRGSNVTMSDVSIVGRGDDAGGDKPRLGLSEFVTEADLIGDGSIPLSVRNGSVDGTQVSVLRHKAEHAISLDNADLSLAHSTVADVELSVSTIGVETTDDEVTESSLDLDHTILGDAGPEGAFVAEIADNRPAVVTMPDEMTVTADYSIVPTGAIESASLGPTNIGVDDSRIGDVMSVAEQRPTASPLADSPAVDAGDPEITGAPATDQRGNERISGVIDIGAVETGSLLQSIAPARFVDTRSGAETIDDQFDGDGKRDADSTYTVQIAGRGSVPADATAVVMNVTSIQPDTNGFVTVFNCDDEQPTASSLNYSVGSNLGNEVIAGLAADGSVCFFTSSSTHLSVDVVAYTTPGSAVQAITPARGFETRLGQTSADGRFGGGGQMPAGSQQTITMGGRFDVPKDASAVIINVTAINPTGNGFATVHPCLPTLPTASSLNFVTGVNRGNEIIAPLSEAGEICVYTSAATDMTIDVVGYLPDGAINTVTPARLLETRAGESTIDGDSEGGGVVAAGSTTTLPVAGRAGIPASVSAVVVNVTAISPSARGFVTVSPCVTPTPTASSLNYEAGVSGGNEIIAEVNDDGEVCLFSSSSTHLAVDVVAYIR